MFLKTFIPDIEQVDTWLDCVETHSWRPVLTFGIWMNVCEVCGSLQSVV